MAWESSQSKYEIIELARIVKTAYSRNNLGIEFLRDASRSRESLPKLGSSVAERENECCYGD